MKKILTLSFGLFGMIGFAQQNTVYVGSPLYQQLKSQNLLGNYNVLQAPSNSVNQATIPYQGTPQNKANAACNCIVPLDSTFLVVPFNSGQAPDYRNDDGSSSIIALPFNFCLYGSTYNSVYINNNGNVSFVNQYFTFTSDSFPSSNYTMVAPFWGDVDTRDSASGLVYYKITPTSLIVRWDNVGYFPMASDKLNDFQLIITDGNDPILPTGTNVGYCYNNMAWTTGSASGGINGFGGTPSTVGANEGDGTSFIQMGRFGDSTNVYDGPFANADGINWLDDQQFYFNSCTDTNSTNVDPILVSNMCDTINLLPGDTIQYAMMVLSGELNQDAWATFDMGSFTDYNVTTLYSLGSHKYLIDINTPLNASNNLILTVTATDDGTPAATTVRQYTLVLEPSVVGLNNKNNNEISVYPNPAKESISIINLNENSVITITDVSGRVIKQINTMNKTQIIDTTGLNEGVYLINIQSQSQSLYTKVMISK
ncbi:MAG TPA: T9SS type A sorting domain-containing protein [Bacteroidia bacterium]|nr:T9SS type A sorting domain-containing protein [Bacteroidia bacterium]